VKTKSVSCVHVGLVPVRLCRIEEQIQKNTEIKVSFPREHLLFCFTAKYLYVSKYRFFQF
jgi:hypothetical protein